MIGRFGKVGPIELKKQDDWPPIRSAGALSINIIYNQHQKLSQVEELQARNAGWLMRQRTHSAAAMNEAGESLHRCIIIIIVI